MTCYIVSFQVKSLAGRQRIRQQLKEFPKYCPINNTCWAIVTDDRAPAIRDKLKEVLTPGDRLFVVRSGTEAAWRGLIGVKHSEWLKKNL